MNRETFNTWLEENNGRLPLVAWGDGHTAIALMFAADMEVRAVRKTLDEALNSGDGSYKP